MNEIIVLDGTKTRIGAADLDGDGKTGGIEILRDHGIMEVKNPTELGESLKELNDDAIDDSTRMSGIDMRSRLHSSELTAVLALDALVALGVCPTPCLAFTRQKKRLSVSLDGLGRREIVDIVQGKQEQEARSGLSSTSIAGRIGSWFKGK